MPTINERIQRLRNLMREKGLDAYIIPSSDPHQSEYAASHWMSREWISGFTGSAGTVIISKEHAGLWTDSRYFIQAETQLANTDMVLHKQKVPHAPEHIQWLKETLPAGAKVACDGNLFSVNQIRSLSKAFYEKNIDLEVNHELITDVWDDRPTLPDNLAFELEVDFAGKSRGEKLSEIKAIMKRDQIDYQLVCTLDDIAWIFNLRSNDVDFNPVTIAFAVIGENITYLFIDRNKLKEEIIESLRADQVSIKDYGEIRAFLAQLDPNIKIQLDPSTTNIRLFQALKEEQIIKQPCHSTLMKSIKNPVEIENIKNAMIKDGVALTRMFRWLDKELNSRTVTEVELGEQLAQFRSQQGEYFGESFSAIVGYKGNGAIVHYRAEPETCAEIKKEGILLLDSGGQYFRGTTDITRTVALGIPTAEQRRNFTLVLKGHIGLAAIRFLKGTRGNQIEILARQHLWKYGLNYGHGTGHGVGYFLNVHEGPQAIGSGATAKAATVLEPGMFTSNEPGFYKPGEYGIRIENLILVVEDQKTEYGQFYKFDTLTLFPIDFKLIDKTLLEKSEIEWLNAYHQEVFDKLSPHLNDDEVEWMRNMCKAI